MLSVQRDNCLAESKNRFRFHDYALSLHRKPLVPSTCVIEIRAFKDVTTTDGLNIQVACWADDLGRWRLR